MDSVVDERTDGLDTVDGLDGRWWLDCPACGLDGGPYSADEAGQLAGTHDDLIHHGQPMTSVVAGGAR